MNADLDVLQSKVLNSCSRPNSGIYKIGSSGEVYCTEQLALASTVTEIGRQITELQNRSALARAPVPLNVYRNFTESAQRAYRQSQCNITRCAKVTRGIDAYRTRLS